jgi:PTS system beta-glucosides-specific IIC component
MLPLTFCVLGPLGYYVGTALSNVIFALYSVAGPVATALLGAISVFALAFGLSRPFFFVCMGIFMTSGVEFVYMPIAMVTSNWLVCGIALGYMIKEKSAEKRQTSITGFTANILGGVSEPLIFGIIIPERKTYLPVIISGALSGFFLGLMDVGYYQKGPTNFLSPIGFIGGESGNFLYGCIASAIAFATAFIMMLLLYKSEQSQKKA